MTYEEWIKNRAASATDLIEKNEKLARRMAQLRDLFLTYGQHDRDCSARFCTPNDSLGPCDCGFSDAINGLEGG